MNTADFKELIDETLQEIGRLLAGSRSGDVFLLDVEKGLRECKAEGYCVSDAASEKLRLLGAAAVRVYDSFDFIPETEKFVSLAVKISSQVATAT